jgi:ferric-dicitrate binding protein FerR (iron transport regulator)
MLENQKNIDSLIARHLAGEATEEEERQLAAWQNESDVNRATFLVLRESANNSISDEQLLITDEAFGNVMAQVNEKKSAGRTINFGFLKTILVSAASIALILISVFTYRQMIYKPGSVADLDQPVLIEKVCPEGQRMQVFLPDGSAVNLNSGSRLQYIVDKNDSIRSVSITGEAYFDIDKNQDSPFYLKTGNIAITTFRSSFNINTHYQDKNVEVVLDEGRMLIENLFSSFRPGMPLRAYLEPGQKASYSLSNLTFEVDKVEETYDYSCWKDDIIFFKQADFITLINTLEKWYGVKFTWDEMPSSNWSFSGVFNNEYLDNVLQALSQEENIRFEKVNDEVKIIFKKENDVQIKH